MQSTASANVTFRKFWQLRQSSCACNASLLAAAAAVPLLLLLLGGRLTTRRTSWKGLQFDHGCQFIRPVSEKFKELCQEWHAAGAITPWDGNIVRLEAKSGNVSPRQQQQQQQQLGEQGALPHTAADNG
jgi:hypothetical protein